MGRDNQHETQKWVYYFGGDRTDGDASLRNLLGGKGANLAEMANLGLPVPPGFTLTTELCTYYYSNDRTYPDALKAEVEGAIDNIGRLVGKTFGDTVNPLLVSVRSGARASMPGMMDTVLNLGLNDQTTAGLAILSGDARFAYDSYRRFIQMYCDVVLGVDHHHFEEILDVYKEDNDISLDTQMSAEDWQHVIAAYKKIVVQVLGREFPQDVTEQLWGAIDAVFGSWRNERANTYRRLHDIPESWGTALNVQAMVFGNMGETSATGVAFTRDPATGENAYYGEFLVNAQGEDVVAGIRTPQPLTIKAKEAMGEVAPSMEEVMPETFRELTDFFKRLEMHYKDMQDIEFTVQEGKLWLLQTRSGKRTGKASLKISVDLCKEGIINKEEAIMRIDPASLDQLLHPSLDPDAHRDSITKGLPASPGAACGDVVFDAGEAEQLAQKGHKIILVREETSPEDIHGMHAATGIVTARGGMTSHAAVVARGMGRPCVCGAGDIRIAKDGLSFSARGRVLKKGERITIDGSTGDVFAGDVKTMEPELSEDFTKIMRWADACRRMAVRTNAETSLDAKVAREFGAQGIGLCRTEHMFFEAERIRVVQEMILSQTKKDREIALAKLLPMQRTDFAELFNVMQELPITIRLLDPPLHEFLPRSEKEIDELALATGMNATQLKAHASMLHECNPMLGHRGCRLGLSYPEIYEMQVRAIMEAACDITNQKNTPVTPEIMIPLVADVKELATLKARVDAVAQEVLQEKSTNLVYFIGTMIELPRAALLADEIATQASFFSFGTNDLTQTTFGVSRDDAGSFLPDYVKSGILEKDPFVSLDAKGVGALIEMAVQKGRQSRPDIKFGICGEHGGDPASIHLVEKMDIDYVSCSPYRVPIARLAAAQAAIARRKE